MPYQLLFIKTALYTRLTMYYAVFCTGSQVQLSLTAGTCENTVGLLYGVNGLVLVNPETLVCGLTAVI